MIYIQIYNHVMKSQNKSLWYNVETPEYQEQEAFFYLFLGYGQRHINGLLRHINGLLITVGLE